MDLFLELFGKLIPLYIYTGIGFWLGRYKKVDTLSINKILVYFILPIVIFNTGYTLNLNVSELAFPLFILAIVTIFTFWGLAVFGTIWSDGRKNISAFNFASGNFGYLGLAVAMTIFAESTASIYTLIIPAMLIHQFTFGVYVIAKGKYPLVQGLLEVAKLPLMYTLGLGLFLNVMDINLGENYINILPSVQGAFIILGMMVIGLALSKVKLNKIDWQFVTLNFIAKFIIWPIAAIFLVAVDQQILQLFTVNHYHAFLLLSILPMSANSIVFANEFDIEPKQTAIAVTLSTIFAIIYIPLMIMFLGINTI